MYKKLNLSLYLSCAVFSIQSSNFAMDNTNKNEEFLRNYGGVDRNNLSNVIMEEHEDGDNIDNNKINTSNYHDFDDFDNMSIFKDKTQFKVLGFISESISSKHDRLKIFLEVLRNKNILFDAICINECWLEQFASDLNLEDYSPFSLPRKVGSKGGLLTFIHNSYQVNELNLYKESKEWEGQFFEVTGGDLSKKVILGNLYVPLRGSESFAEFHRSISPIINELTDKYKHIIITGDLNADALKFNSCSLFRNFFDTIMNFGLLPVITLPTHFGTRNCSIIDHVYIKSENPIT